MMARKIKSRDQILRTIMNLRKDLYFSFGVPDNRLGKNMPEHDPRVAVEISGEEAYQWTNDVAFGVDYLHSRFERMNGLPMPKPERKSRVREPAKPSPLPS
jgi:hypothetical protein